MKMLAAQEMRKPIHPGLMMACFWVGLYVLYLVAPITQTPGVSLQGFGFVVMMVALFGIAAGIGASGTSLQKPEGGQECRPEAPAFRLLSLFLLVGIMGGVASICAKVGALQELSLAGFAALRQERAIELIAMKQETHGLLSALGFLCYPAGFVAVVLVIVRYEQTRVFARGLAITYFAIVFLLGIVFGGRSMIFVLILFVALGAYLRRCRGLAMVPRSKSLRRVLVGLVLLFVVYSTLIWQVRADLSDMDLAASMQHAEQVWGVKPTASLEWLAETLDRPSLTQSVMNTVFYFTQSIATLEKVLAMNDMPILLGGYHIDLMAAAMRTSPESAAFLSEGYAALLDENIYGYFAGAWGGLYIDFGLFGSILGVVFWGWFAGRAYRAACRDVRSDRVILYVFWLYSILIGFVSPPFGFSNSAMIFFWFVAYFVFSRHFPSIRLSGAVSPSKESLA